MRFIVRRKDPPAYPGAETRPWQTVARRKTLKEAREAMEALKKFTKLKGTVWWCGEETDLLSKEEQDGMD